jgi:sugar O-acyltransferase (sialic acid O-acetyltransferase NeuD family)
LSQPSDAIILNVISRRLIIIGAGGQAANVYAIAISLGYEVAMFVHEGKSGQRLYQLPIIKDLREVKSFKDYDLFVAIGDNKLRESYVKNILTMYPEASFPSLVHPSVILAPFSKVGRGTIVMPNCVIGAKVIIGEFCILGSLSCVGHDSTLNNFSFVGPSAVLAGGVTLGLKSTVAIGAGVREKVIIGNGALVGAYSFLNNDLGDHKTLICANRTVIRDNFNDDSYLV